MRWSRVVKAERGYCLRRKVSAGFTLIEFMVAIALGTIFILMVGFAFTNVIKGSNENLQSATLEQNVNAMLDIMASEVRRAGYWNGGSGDTYPDPTLDATNANYPHIYVNNAGDCVLYFYDRNEDGNWQNGEFGGFMLDTNSGVGVIKLRRTCSGTPATGDATNYRTACLAEASCTPSADWETLSDDELVSINSLAFTTTGSNCVNLGGGSTNDEDNWEVTSDSATSFHCPCTATSDPDITFTDDDDPPTDTCAANVPVTDDQVVGLRQVNITVLAEAQDDSGIAKRVSTSVRLGNDLICTLPNCPS